MNGYLYYILICIGLLIAYYTFLYIRSELLPGARRLRKERDGRETGVDDTIALRIDLWVKTIVKKEIYDWLFIYLSKNGQSHDWTVPKAIRNIVVSLFIGIFFSGFFTLIYFTVPDANIGLLLLAIITLPMYPAMPLLLFKSRRNDFVAKIIYQTPELLDILEAELVRGSGNMETALERAQEDLDGELRMIMRHAYQHLQINRGDYDGACTIIEQTISIPLYDQVTQLLKQYRMTGRAKRNIDTLQKSCRVLINTTIRKQTQQKNLLITIVTIGILINLAILIGVPILYYMLNTQFFPA